MNGYTLLAESYKKAAENGILSKEQSIKKIRVLEFLATCDQEDIYNLFDSSAFNDITKNYLKYSIESVISEGIISKEQGNIITDEFNSLFSDISAKEICDKYI